MILKIHLFRVCQNYFFSSDLSYFQKKNYFLVFVNMIIIILIIMIISYITTILLTIFHFLFIFSLQTDQKIPILFFNLMLIIIIFIHHLTYNFLSLLNFLFSNLLSNLN